MNLTKFKYDQTMFNLEKKTVNYTFKIKSIK